MNLIPTLQMAIYHKHRNYVVMPGGVKGLQRYIEGERLSVVGSWNRLYSQSRKKYYLWDEKYLCTEPDIAREYLHVELLKIGRKKLCGGIHSLPMDYWFPQHCIVGTYNEVFHIDLKACFYSIYRQTGIDCICEIIRSPDGLDLKYFGWGELNASLETMNELGESKGVRNTIFGCTLPASVLRFNKNSDWTYQQIKTQYTNAGLKNIILLILHRITAEIIDDVLYWNIDGGFVGMEGLVRVMRILERFGLPFTFSPVAQIKIGGLGIYNSEEFKSLRWGQAGSNVSNLILVNREIDDDLIRILRRF